MLSLDTISSAGTSDTAMVSMDGELTITFQYIPGRSIEVQPKWVAVKAFTVPAQNGNRKLKVETIAIRGIRRGRDRARIRDRNRHDSYRSFVTSKEIHAI